MAVSQKSKATAKKVVVGKTKKKTAWWKKLYIGSAAGVLLLAVGFSGYTWWQDRQLKASAFSWQTVYPILTSVGNINLRMCKINNNYYKVYLQNLSNYSARVWTQIGSANVAPHSNSPAFTVYSSNGIGSAQFTYGGSEVKSYTANPISSLRVTC